MIPRILRISSSACFRAQCPVRRGSRQDSSGTRPAHPTKNRDPHRLRLLPLALDVPKARRRAAAEAQAGGDPAKLARILASGQPRAGLVFPAPRSGRVVDAFGDPKAALGEAGSHAASSIALPPRRPRRA